MIKQKTIGLTADQLVQMISQAMYASIPAIGGKEASRWAEDTTHLLAIALGHIREEDREIAISDTMERLRELIPQYAAALAIHSAGPIAGSA